MKIQLTENNFEQQYFFNLGNDVKQLISPLSKIGITFFSHTRVWQDQSISALSTHPSYNFIFMKERFYESVFVGSPNIYQSGIVFYDDLYHVSKDISTLQDVKISCIEHTSFKPDIMFINKLDNYVDLYWLGTSRGLKNTHSLYLNNINYIKKYLTQLHQDHTKLFRKTYDHHLIYPTESKELTSLSLPSWHEETCLRLSDCNNINSTIASQLIYKYKFTKKEASVAVYLIQGYTLKEISYVLNISSRTTEKHIMKLKQKTSSRSLIKLIYCLNQYLI